jgi:hypothetical protein
MKATETRNRARPAVSVHKCTTRVLYYKHRGRSINGDAVDCKSAAFGHDWFDPSIPHQINNFTINGNLIFVFLQVVK